MAQITAALVKQLREMTDSPMMECKKALVEADGDIEKAVDVLRKMGVAKAVKRAGRDTNEGTIAAYVSEDGKTGALLELTCETDFVGTNPKFTGFANELAKVVVENDPADDEALKACVSLTERYVSDRLLPDKAIDALDEAGARVRIAHVEVPEDIIALENEITRVEGLKKEVLAQKSYNEAAEYRDQERQLREKLADRKRQWETNDRDKRVQVTDQDVAEVVAMMTGVPVQRIASS